MRTGWDVDGVGHIFGNGVKDGLDAAGMGDLWKSGPTPDPFWDWYKDWGWTSQQFVEFCNWCADQGYLFTGHVRPGYKEAINKVKDMGHDIIIGTDRTFGSRPSISEQLTYDWFDNEGIYYDEIIFTADKRRCHCDTFVDDKLQNYDDLHEAGTLVALINRPWNKVEGGDNRMRIDTLDEYVSLIELVDSMGLARIL